MVFGGQILDQLVCQECGATSEPLLRSGFTHMIYASELINTARQYPQENFSKLMAVCLRSSHRLHCPNFESNRCKSSPKLQAYLLDSPLVMAISIVWQSNQEDVSHLVTLMNTLSYRLFLSQIFSVTSNEVSPEVFFFRGMVCYYGLHYVSIFQDLSSGTPRFLLFDDARIRVIGRWRDVLTECRRARYQPVLLLYEKDSGTDDYYGKCVRIINSIYKGLADEESKDISSSPPWNDTGHNGK